MVEKHGINHTKGGIGADTVGRRIGIAGAGNGRHILLLINPANPPVTRIPDVNIVGLITSQGGGIGKGGEENSLSVKISRNAASGKRFSDSGAGVVTVDAVSAGIVKVVDRIKTDAAAGIHIGQTSV